MRAFLRLSYDGSKFHGWQTQPNAPSVQQTIEEALSTILRNPTPIVGAGRTDTGVNARMMMAHLELPDDVVTDPAAKANFLRALNSLVGKEIAIEDVLRVPADAHARFDATSRTYHYYVHTSKDPFLRSYSLLYPNLDFEAMNVAAGKLLDVSDFTSFAKLHSDAKTNICRVTEARWEELGNGRYVFIITADRFLRNMVRAVVGTLLEVGRGKITLADFDRIITDRDRCSAGTSMPPHPLFLWSVTYPYLP